MSIFQGKHNPITLSQAKILSKRSWNYQPACFINSDNLIHYYTANNYMAYLLYMAHSVKYQILVY